MCRDYASVNQPPVQKEGPSWESICQCHDNQMKEDNGQGVVQALDCLLNDVSFGKYNQGNVQDVGYNGRLTVPLFSPIEGLSGKNLRTMRPQTCYQVDQDYAE